MIIVTESVNTVLNTINTKTSIFPYTSDNIKIHYLNSSLIVTNISGAQKSLCRGHFIFEGLL